MLLALLCNIYGTSPLVPKNSGNGDGLLPQQIQLEVHDALTKDHGRIVWTPDPHICSTPENQRYSWEILVMVMMSTTGGMPIRQELSVKSGREYPAILPKNPVVEWVADGAQHKSYAYCHLLVNLQTGPVQITGHTPVKLTEAIRPIPHMEKRRIILPTDISERDFNSRLTFGGHSEVFLRCQIERFFTFTHPKEPEVQYSEGTSDDTVPVRIEYDSQRGYEQKNSRIYPYIRVLWQESRNETRTIRSLLFDRGYQVQEEDSFRRGVHCYQKLKQSYVDLSDIGGPTHQIIGKPRVQNEIKDVYVKSKQNPLDPKQTFTGYISQEPNSYPQIVEGERRTDPGWLRRFLVVRNTWEAIHIGDNTETIMWQDASTGEKEW